MLDGNKVQQHASTLTLSLLFQIEVFSAEPVSTFQLGLLHSFFLFETPGACPPSVLLEAAPLDCLSQTFCRTGWGSLAFVMMEPRAFAASERVGSDEPSVSVSFFSSGNILQCTGALHLYKRHAAALTAAPGSPTTDMAALHETQHTIRIDYPDETVYAALAIPLDFGPADFLQWTGSWLSQIQHFRFVKDASPGRYVCLIQFNDAVNAAAFYQSMNGKSFSSFFSQNCHLAPIEAVEIKGTHVDPVQSVQHSFVSSPMEKSELDRVELPTCPVCLERMDGAISGLATTFCHHTFHCECLSRWEDSTCPVCRYTGFDSCRHPRRTESPAPKPSSSVTFLEQRQEPAGQVSSDPKPTCAACEAESNLWICLLCGSIGCGRYQKGHAHEHYLFSDHPYALELETQRVWDYLGDGYVHRLLQNKLDGKIVALTSPIESTRSQSVLDKDAGPDEFRAVFDADGSGTVYSSAVLFSIQLESQKDFYEKQLEEMTMKHSLACQMLESKWEQRLSLLEAERRAALAEHDSNYAQLDRQYVSLKEKFKASLQKAAELQKSYDEEKMLSSGLVQRVAKLSETVSSQSSQIEELQSQVNDLCLHFQAQSVLSGVATGPTVSTPMPTNGMQVTSKEDPSALLEVDMSTASISVQPKPSSGTGKKSFRSKHRH